MRSICAVMAMTTFALMLVLQPSSVRAQGGDRPALVEVDEVVSEPLAQTAPVIGRLVARQRGTVASLTRGPVARVAVDVGDRVREGDILVELARDRLTESVNAAEAAVARQRAALTTARSQLNLSQQELARLEKLQNSPAFSPARYDDKLREVQTARARVGEAQAAIDAANADKRLAEIDLELGLIRAPYNGVVIEKQAVRGAYANIGDPMVTLLNDEDLEIEADVPSRLLAGLESGRLVSFQVGMSGARHDAVVRAQIPEENALTKTRAVRFVPGMDTQSLGRQLAPGSTVNVLIPVGEQRDVVTVHKDAVLPQNGDSVFIVIDGKAQPRPVTLGEAVGGRFIVESGLKPGDIVVIMGNERLRPGQGVTTADGPVSGGDKTGGDEADSDKTATVGETAG